MSNILPLGIKTSLIKNAYITSHDTITFDEDPHTNEQELDTRPNSVGREHLTVSYKQTHNAID